MAKPKTKSEPNAALSDRAAATDFLLLWGADPADLDQASDENLFEWVSARLAAIAVEEQAALDAPGDAHGDAPRGRARIRHAAGATSLSFDGETYTADEAGVFDVPHQAIEALAAHGFELV
jgi:hypothetical protein